MLLLSKLKAMTAGLLILAVVVVAGSRCASWESARAAMPGDDPTVWTEADKSAPAGKVGKSRPTESSEATFVFRGADTGRKTVSLVVAGTSAPVLCLPIKDDVRVLVGGRRAGIDGLRSGAKIAIRLDSTNSVIKDIWSLEDPGKATVLKSASELAHLDTPSDAEVLRALRPSPRDVPAVLEVYRDDVTVVTERLVKQVDPPRFFPLVGEAELHHCHWKCTVYSTETLESGYPYPLRVKRPCVDVVYIDKNYLVPTK
jgi:hypothetical protein